MERRQLNVDTHIEHLSSTSGTIGAVFSELDQCWARLCQLCGTKQKQSKAMKPSQETLVKVQSLCAAFDHTNPWFPTALCASIEGRGIVFWGVVLACGQGWRKLSDL